MLRDLRFVVIFSLLVLATGCRALTPTYTGPSSGVVAWNDTGLWGTNAACIGTSLVLPPTTSITLDVNDDAYSDTIYLSEGSMLYVSSNDTSLTVGADTPTQANAPSCFEQQYAPSGSAPSTSSASVGIYIGIVIAVVIAAIVIIIFVVIRTRRNANKSRMLEVNKFIRKNSANNFGIDIDLEQQNEFKTNNPDGSISNPLFAMNHLGPLSDEEQQEAENRESLAAAFGITDEAELRTLGFDIMAMLSQSSGNAPPISRQQSMHM